MTACYKMTELSLGLTGSLQKSIYFRHCSVWRKKEEEDQVMVHAIFRHWAKWGDGILRESVVYLEYAVILRPIHLHIKLFRIVGRIVW